MRELFVVRRLAETNEVRTPPPARIALSQPLLGGCQVWQTDQSHSPNNARRKSRSERLKATANSCCSGAQQATETLPHLERHFFAFSELRPAHRDCRWSASARRSPTAVSVVIGQIYRCFAQLPQVLAWPASLPAARNSHCFPAVAA